MTDSAAGFNNPTWPRDELTDERYRSDRNPEEADTIADLRKLL